jgi:hypothetical protein
MTYIMCGASVTGIPVLNLQHIQIFKTSKKLIFSYGDGSTKTVTGADAQDFITTALPFFAAMAPISRHQHC